MNFSLNKENWKRVKLGDVVQWYQKDIPNQEQQAKGIDYYIVADHIDPNTLAIKRYGHLDDGGKGPTITKHFQKGDILLSTRSTALKKAGIAPVDGVTGEKLLVLRTTEQSELLTEFFPFTIQNDSFWNYAINSAAGSVNKFTSWTKLREYEFLLPPKEEQARLAELLWAGDELVERYDAMAERAKDYQVQFINSWFFQELPAGWKMLPLNACCTLQTGIAKGKKYTAGEELMELPYLSVANVQDGYINTSEIKSIRLSKKEVGHYRLESGDVLIAEGGDFDKVGRGGVWNGFINPCLHQNHVFAIRPNKEKLIPMFLSFQTGSHYGKSYFLGCAKKTSNLASINSSQVKDFPTIVPPLAIQKELVQKAEGAALIIKSTQEHCARFRNIQSYLINQIFSTQ